MPLLKCQADLLIFDLDGTLVDTRRDLANAVNYALRQFGKNDLDLQTLTSYVGDGVRKLLERALGNSSEAELEIALRHFRHFYFEHVADCSQLYSGILAVLEYFSNKKKAVLTNKPQELTEALLQRLEICEHFALIIGAQPNLKLKPDADGVFKILNHCNASTDKTIIIGDSENDIHAGKSAGIMTCAVSYGFRPLAELVALQPDFVAKHPADLKRLIN
jgi:phosphoglycolate phosphatase